MEISGNTQVYGLIGHPVASSLSPLIHNQAFKILDINAIYTTFCVKEENLKEAVQGLKALGIKGFNVTMPHKQEIIKYLDEVDKEAQVLGAVNTVKSIDGRLIGYNTDGAGFINSLLENDIDLEGKNILLLGAGGAAYGIGLSLGQENIKSISIGNRTKSKAQDLANKINGLNPQIKIQVYDLDLEGLDKKDIDIIVNTTSLGMDPNNKILPTALEGFSKDLIVYDIIYRPKDTLLLNKAREKGYKVVGGISLLYYQALLSLEIWLELNSENLNKLINIEELL